MFDLKEMVVNALAGHAIGLLGIPGIIGLAAAALVGWKLMQGAHKAILLLVLLGIGGAGVWWFWLKGGTAGIPGKTFLSGLLNPPTPEPPQPTEQPAEKGKHGHRYPLTPPRRSGTALSRLPRYRKAEPGQPLPPPRTPAERLKPFIDALHDERVARVEQDPDWLSPEASAARINAALARNEERKRRDTLLAQQGRGFASVPPSPPAPPRMMTPDQARAQAFDMESRRIDDAQALSLRMQQKYGPPTAYAGAGERRWR